MIYNQEDYLEDMNGDRHPQEHEQIWGDMRETPENEQEPPPQEALLSTRFDSITSTTLFVNPNLIQPPNPSRYSGAPVSNPPLQTQAQATSHQISVPVSQVPCDVFSQIQTAAGGGNGNGIAVTTFSEEKLFQDIQEGRRRLSITEEGTVLLHDVEGHESNHSFALREENIETASTHSTFIDESTNHSNQTRFKQENEQKFFVGSQQEAMAGGSRQIVVDHGHYSRDLNTDNFNGHKGLVSMEPSPCGIEISTKDFPGCFNFEVSFTETSNSTKNKHWEYSHELKKLFINYNKWVQVEFKVGRQPPPDLIIRTLPVFSEPAYQREPVKRCPNHANLNHQSNTDFSFTEHLIRYQNENTRYQEDMESQRLYTLFNAGTPHQGTDVITRMMKFMCLGSDAGGINRRPIKVVFTLELQGRVVGRKVVDVRICSCPRRDLQQETQKHHEFVNNAKRIADKFAISTTVPTKVCIQPPPGKKRKMENPTVIMVPVHADDFKKLNEFAESAWVCRDPENADNIKETRRKMLQKHNSELIKKIDQKKF